MSRVRFLASLLTLLTLLLGACTMPMPMSGAMNGAPAAEMAAPQPVPGQVTVANARARTSPMAQGNGAAYMVVLNGTDAAVRLAAAASDVAAAVELHETIEENGVMKMVPRLDGFEIPAGGSVELKPGGKHVMLIGLVAPLQAGKPFSLTLTFDNGTTIDLSVPVIDMSAEGAMGGMEEMHETEGMGGEDAAGEGTQP